MRTPTVAVLLVLGLAACRPDANPGDSKPDTKPDNGPEPVVEGVDWSGDGIRFKYPEGMRVKVRDRAGHREIDILENPEKPSSVSVAIHLLTGLTTPVALDMHRRTTAATTRKGLEGDGAKFAPNGEIEREIAGEKRKGTVLEFDFGPAHYRLEVYSIDLGGRLVGVIMRHEPHEKEIALKAFTTMAKTLAAAPK